MTPARKQILAGRDAILRFMHEHNNWPAPEKVMAGGYDECSDEAEAMTTFVLEAAARETPGEIICAQCYRRQDPPADPSAPAF